MRKRATFKFASENTTDNEDDGHVMDEQEQEELIERLRDESLASNRQYLLILQAAVGLSCLLHIIYLLNPSKESPLLVFSPSTQPEPPIPLSTPLTLLAITIHLNLGLLLYPDRESFTDIPPLAYTPMLGLAALAPALALLLGRGWLTFAWWCVTGGIVWMAQSVQHWIDKGEEGISELEGMKYIAPGA